MSDPVTTTDVVEALAKRGFQYCGRQADQWLKFEGLLAAGDGTYPCAFAVDPRFMAVPRVKLLQVPKSLQPLAPHVDSDGGLCYLAKGSVVLDIFDPVGQTLACLVRAELVLHKILSKELVADLQEEFFAFWGGPLCLVDLQGKSLGEQVCFAVRPGETLVGVVTDEKERTIRKLACLGWSETGDTMLTYRIRTRALPRPLQGAWPPETVRDVMKWQSFLDSNCRKKIEQRIEEARLSRARGRPGLD